MPRGIQIKASFNGSADRVLGVVRDTFVQNNFRILSATPTAFDMRGPGMNSTQQNPLVGISRVRVETIGHELSATAELGGVWKMGIFLVALIVGLGLLFSFSFPSSNSTVHMLAFSSLSPWIVLIPVMVYWIRRRTLRALDTLLSNAAAIADATASTSGVRHP